MNKLRSVKVLGILMIAVAGLIQSCSTGAQRDLSKNEVVIHMLADADMLLPINSTSANSTYIEGNIFQSLLGRDPETLELVGILAVDRPIIEEIDEGEYEGGMRITYEIRPEARWDNGDPITAHDVDFTFKAIKNPRVNNEHLKPYMDFIKEIVIDEENPRLFTLYSDQRYMLAEEFSGYIVLPEYVYDPNGLMRNYSLKQLSDLTELEKIRGDRAIIDFADNFNSERYQREIGYVVGSGPYEFKGWATGQRITLQKKEDWWGDELADRYSWFQANPQRIVYEIINDMTTAVTSLRDQGLDVIAGLRPRDFINLTDDSRFQQNFNLYSPIAYSYVYIGMNMRIPKLEDVRVRKALAHLVDKEQIIEVINYGLAEETIGPIHPTKEYYHDGLRPIDYNVERARELLAEAGWKDLTGDGILNKEIDGDMETLRLEFLYNSGNDIRRNIGLIFKENARRAGVDIDVQVKEWTVFIDLTKSHQFELFCGGWISGPGLDDPKQIWHTESSNNGSNYVGFGTEESDMLIDSIRVELDPEVRNQMYRRFQEIVSEEVPYIFLYTPKNLLAIHSRWDNAEPSILRPGYNETSFKLKPEFTESSMTQ
ncbi:MAG: ABC transporter substrate-binding protein [Chitinophagaceae bacterium]|nr:MAG: ABC transporter substrate-binding protein [Chitinophagaceae bacterium]